MSSVALLPEVVKPIKDAAKAAKRAIGKAVQRVATITVSQLLDLPGLIVTDYEIEQRGENEIVHLYCEHRDAVAICPRCRTVSAQSHDGKMRCVRDLGVWGKRTFVHFRGRRFDCESCERPFTEGLPWLDRQRRQTRRFEQHIFRRCLDSSCKAVAAEEGLHEATVKGIFKRWARRTVRLQGSPRVRVLGIDEIALKKRHKQFALVISDLERRCVIAVLPGREKKRLEKWFDALTADARQGIRVVSIDMWNPYRLAVQAKLPHANLVADRFHVMKQLNDRLTQLRRSVQRHADQETRDVLKGCRWLLVKNHHELTDDEDARLQAVLAASPEIRTAYLLKEEFRTIFEKTLTRPQAERFLRAWMWKATHTGDPRLAKFVQTLLNWWQEILNYFDERVTNGFVEGINRAIRVIINRAYGFRNFENFRLQVIAQHGPPVALPH